MTDRELLESIFSAIAETKNDVKELKNDVNDLKDDVKVLKSDVTDLKEDVKVLKSDVTELNRKMNAVCEQTAGLTEFKTEVTKVLGRHELDIQLLKKLSAN